MISIIVPAYNVKKYIKSTIESICGQTYENIEIIVVNDGSTDGTGDLINQISKTDDRIKVIHKQNGGVTSARIEGIKASTGDWIGFVDGDDIIEPYMFEKLIDNAIKYDAQISHCGFQMQFIDGRTKFFYNTGKVFLQDQNSALISLLKGDFIEPGLCNKLFKKDLFVSIINNSKLDYSIKNNEDLLMNYMLFSNASTLIYEDFCPYVYKIREESASRGELNSNKIFDPIKVKQIIHSISDEKMKKHTLSAYISTCINQYNSLIFKKTYTKDIIKVKNLIKEQRSNFNLLPLKRRIFALLIFYLPIFYKLFYWLYSKCFQKNKYY